MITPMDNLINVMNLRPTGVIAVCRTSDGHYLGQHPGDIGYNVFLGSPKPHPGPGRDRSTQVWNALTLDAQAAVKKIASSPLDGYPIPLTDFVDLC